MDDWKSATIEKNVYTEIRVSRNEFWFWLSIWLYKHWYKLNNNFKWENLEFYWEGVGDVKKKCKFDKDKTNKTKLKCMWES